MESRPNHSMSWFVRAIACTLAATSGSARSSSKAKGRVSAQVGRTAPPEPNAPNRQIDAPWVLRRPRNLVLDVVLGRQH